MQTRLRIVFTAGNEKEIVGEVKKKMDDSELVPHFSLACFISWRSFLVPFFGKFVIHQEVQ